MEIKKKKIYQGNTTCALYTCIHHVFYAFDASHQASGKL